MKIVPSGKSFLLAAAVGILLLATPNANAQGSGYSTASINVTEFNFTPSAIDSTNGPQTVTITVRVTDSERDVWLLSVYFQSPVVSHQLGFNTQTDRISGDARDGVYRKTFTFNQYSTRGTWVVSKVNVFDGNSSYYRWRDNGTPYLSARGFSTLLQVINNNELFPPEIDEFSFTPNSVGNSRSVTVTIRARDLESGVSEISGSFTNPPNCYVYDDECTAIGFGLTAADRITGDDRDGIYRRVFNIPDVSPGTYAANIAATDGVRNRTYLYSNDLAIRGFPYQLQIGASTLARTWTR